MSRDREDLDRLIAELARLSPEERTHVVSEALRRAGPNGPAHPFTPPLIRGGTAWVGGTLSRDELYGDDGR